MGQPRGSGDWPFEKPYFTLGPSEDLLLHNVPCSPLPLRTRAFGAPTGQPATATAPTAPGPLAEYEDPAHPAWRLLRAVVATWAGESSVPVVVFLLPTPDFVEGRADPTAYRRRFSELGQDLGVPVVDALETVHELVPSFLRRELRFPLDHHPSKFAHQVLAASLAKAVAPLLDRDPATCQ